MKSLQNEFNKIRLMAGLFVMVSAFGLSGCESDEDAKIAKAQQCLNKATQGGGATCATLVAGNSSEKASLIRCAALFIDNGFVGDRISKAFDGLSKKSTGTTTTNPLITTMAFMTFPTMDKVNEAVGECERSRVTSMDRLAKMAQMPTYMATRANAALPGGIPTDRPLTEAEMQAVIDEFANASSSEKAELGAMVVQAEQSFCSDGSAFKGTKTCTDLEAATAAGNTATIGAKLLCQLKPTTPGC